MTAAVAEIQEQDPKRWKRDTLQIIGRLQRAALKVIPR
jgi:hypothetical protein